MRRSLSDIHADIQTYTNKRDAIRAESQQHTKMLIELRRELREATRKPKPLPQQVVVIWPPERRAEVLRLRLDGFTLRELGKKFGVSATRISHIEGRALRDIGLEHWQSMRREEMAKARAMVKP